MLSGAQSLHNNLIKSSWQMTYHFEVIRSALCAVEVAGQQHVVDVVSGAVVEFPHVERSRLKIVEVGFDLQAL